MLFKRIIFLFIIHVLQAITPFKRSSKKAPKKAPNAYKIRDNFMII